MAILQVELVNDIPENWTPLEVISVVKALDEEGNPALCIRTSGGLTQWEMLGMAVATSDALREQLRSEMTDP